MVIDAYAITTAQSTRKTVQQVTEFFALSNPLKIIDYDYLKFSQDFKGPIRMPNLMRSTRLRR